MPLQSKSQSRLFHWAASHPSAALRERGIKPAVTEEFLASAHGKSLKGLPERVQHKAHGGAVTSRPPMKW